MVVELENCFVMLSAALGAGIGLGICIDLLAYGITKALSLINIKM